MQINATRQQVLQAFAKARQAMYRLLGFPFGILFAVVLIPWSNTNPLTLLGMLNVAVQRFLQPLDWQPVHGWYPLQVIAYYCIVCAALELIYIPFTFYLEYTLPRRFKLGVRSPRKTIIRIVQAQGKLVIRWALLTELFYLFFALQPLLWWIEMALILSVLTLIEQERSPAKIKRLFAVSSLPEGELAQRLRTLLQRFSLLLGDIVLVDKPGEKMEANAYILGFGRKRLIGISSTMLKEFSLDEIEVMFAHELGHYVHRDQWRRFAVRTLIRLVGYAIIYGILLLLTSAPMYAYHGIADVTTIPFFLIAQIMFWVYGSVSYNSFSRSSEREADEFALQTTGMTTAFKHAMIRMANINRVVANPTENLSTHPTIVSRIKHADEFAAKHGIVTAQSS